MSPLKTKGKSTSRKQNTHSVAILNSKGNPKKKFVSIYSASIKTGVNSGSISKAVRGIVQTAGGFRWKLV